VYALLRGWPEFRARKLWQGLRGVGALALMTIVALVLAAGQLLPTLELSGLSVRSGGLPYNEAVSFSKRAGGAILGLALVGLLLAFGAYNPVYYLLYKLVPGFDLFRAPARWLLLYTFGAAILAGIGLEILPWPFKTPAALGKSPDPASQSRAKWASSVLRAWKPAIVLLLVIELLIAGRRLAYSRPTAPAAFDSLRTAPSHLLADAAYQSAGEPFRFLSMSDIRYDPGDLEDLQTMYASDLPEEAIYDLVVATKMKEVLAYNLPLRYRLFSVDGYDGGLLPTSDYVTLERLFLSEDEIWPDGRLRQQLRQVPPARLLSLLNVKYVITDKTQDAWIDDVFYDLEHTVPLGDLALAGLPRFDTTHLGVVSYLAGAANLPDGTPVAEVTISGSDGSTITRTLRAGEHTAEGLYNPESVAHRQAQVGHRWRDNEQGSDYIALLDLDQALLPETISIRSLLPGERFHLRGLSLIDDQTGTSRNLSIDPAYRLVHSGDVKIYQNLAVLPRAFVVHQARAVASEEQALDLMRSPSFDPANELLLIQAGGDEPAPGTGRSDARIVSYQPEQIRIEASLDSPGYLVLTDAHYPGWEAEVNGQPVPIERANLYFRAVRLPPGEHEVVFTYTPSSARLGLAVGLAAWVLWALFGIVGVVRIGRKS
jgi:hypothetical protein